MKKYSCIFLLVAILIFGLLTTAGAEKVYKIGIVEDPTTINLWAILGPGEGSVYNQQLSGPYFNSLVGIAYPSYANVPSLADGMPGPFQQEGDYYTNVVKLREGLLWSDGNEFTADDVVFTYNTIIDFDLQANWKTYHPDSLIKVEKVDDYNVKFYFNTYPGLAEWDYGVLYCSILSKAEWEDVAEEAKTKADPAQHLTSYEVTDPATLGGFDFGKWEKGAFFQSVAAENYQSGTVYKFYENGRHEIVDGDWSWAGWGEEGSELKLEYTEGPHIDSVVYRLFTNQEAQVMALKKGEIDYILSSLGLAKGFREDLSKTAGVEIAGNPSNGYRYLAFNKGNYPFGMMVWNEAMATLIDREYVVDNVLQGAAEPNGVCGPPPGNAYWHNPNVEIAGQGLTRAQRVAKAVEMLEEAGFSWEVKPEVDLENDTYTAGSGIIMPDGNKMEPFEMLVPPPGYDPLRATFGLWIQMWLNEVGVPVMAKSLQFNVIMDIVFGGGDYDAYIFGWGLGGAYPNFLKNFFHSEGSWNVLNYNDSVYDQIIDEFTAATDIEVARDLAYQAQERLAKTLPNIPLFSTPIYDAYLADRITYPTTDVLDGIQNFNGVPTYVTID